MRSASRKFTRKNANRAFSFLLFVCVGLCLFAAPLPAAVDGTVINGTTGKPQAGVILTLVKPGMGGLETLDTARSGPGGKFTIGKSGQPPMLLQSIHDGVIYTTMIAPGAPTSGIRVNVFDATTKPEAARITQDMILLQPTGSQLGVNETVLLQNDGKLTFNDPDKGSFQFYLPDAANGQVQLTITPPGGMALQRDAGKTKQPNVYKVDYPIQPGETRIDVAYVLPPSDPQTFSGKILHREGPTRLITPSGVTLSGKGLKPLGQEPTTQANIYEIANGPFKVDITGTGTLSGDSGGGSDDNGAPGIVEARPRIYGKLYWVLGLSLAILGIGFALLYRNDPQAAQPAAKGKRKA